MQKITDLETLRSKVASWRKSDLRIALVPTMGALHEGHLSLVRLAKQHADKVIVSIFINPTQFNEAADFERYPREEDKDSALLEAEGADLLFMPNVDVMYPHPFFTTVNVSKVTEDLEGAHRPGHFEGVATIVTKLLLQSLPDVAVFGEKDYQQLCLIRNLARDLNIPTDIIGAPIMRDEEGLALSSRNVFLSDEGLAHARQLNKVLYTLADDLENGRLSFENLSEEGARRLIGKGLKDIDYIELRTADFLEKVTSDNEGQELRLLCVVRVDDIRLLDNVAVKPIK